MDVFWSLFSIGLAKQILQVIHKGLSLRIARGGLGLAELADQIFLFIRQLGRDLQHDLGIQVAGPLAAHVGHAFALHAEHVAGLRACRNLKRKLLGKSGDRNGIAQSCLAEGDGHFEPQIVALAGKQLVVAHVEHYVQVTCRTAVGAGLALTLQRQHVIRVGSCRDRNVERNGLADLAGTAAGRARIFDDLTGAAAVIAGTDALELAQRRVLYGADLAGAAAVRTGLRAGALLRAGAAAGIAGAVLRQPDLLLAAEHRFVERDVHALLDIRTAPRTVPRLPAAAAESETAAEHVEDVLKPAEAGRVKTAEPASAAVSGVRIHAGEAEAVVFFFFVGVRQNGIGLVDLLELLLRRFVAGVSVRVILHGHLAEGRLDLIFRGALFQS